MDLSPIHLSNNLLSRAFAEGRTIQPPALEYLLWNLDGLYEARHGERLLRWAFEIRDDGPVCWTIRHKTHLTSPPYRNEGLRTYLVAADDKKRVIDESALPGLREALDTVWSSCKNLSLIDLHEASVADGSRWASMCAH